MTARPHHAAACAALITALLAIAPAHANSDDDVSALFPGKLRASHPIAKLCQKPDGQSRCGVVVDDGKHIALRWTPPGYTDDTSLVFRTENPDASPDALRGALNREVAEKQIYGDWTLISISTDATFVDEVEPGTSYRYAVVTARPSVYNETLVGVLSAPSLSEPIAPQVALFNIDRWAFLMFIVLLGAALYFYYLKVQKNPDDVFIRRIPGVDAIEESVGRSTEMGRPVLYVTGTEEIQNIQTIASLLILGRVAEMVAEYDTDMKVANFFPLTMVVAEEIVKQGFASAGRLDAHRPENVMFISAEQFAFAAGVNGMILRDRPATNIYLGRFFAESLILAETGYVTKAIQIAGTAEITQLPFFIAACDYTIIGEELYAVSAYLSREPVLLATLKATDFVKVVIVILMLGALTSTFGWFDIGPWLVP